MTTNTQMLEEILNDLEKIGGIESSAIMRRDGVIIVSHISTDCNEETFAAMSATMLGAAETAISRIGKGVLNKVIVESKHYKLVVVGAGPKALLVVMTSPNIGLGLIIMEVEKAAEKIKKILKTENLYLQKFMS
ncbi:MAG TPA: roadblock/LC7 domain-containing protein [Methanosarcinales archaeon]|nr:roadblock/LC7 domain-containing protein [Methanosarcinales archaeon]